MPDDDTKKQDEPLEEVVDEEGEVHEAFIEGELTPDQVNEIDTLEELAEEADKIEAKKAAGKVAEATPASVVEAPKVEIPKVQEEVKKEDVPPQASVSPEVVTEAKKEPTGEISGEVGKEFKQGI